MIGEWNEKNSHFAIFIQGEGVSGAKEKGISISIIENLNILSSDGLWQYS